MKVYGKQNYGEIDYILKASKFFIEVYPRILSSRNIYGKMYIDKTFTEALLIMEK